MSRTRKLLKLLLIAAIFFIAVLIAIPNLIRSRIEDGDSVLGAIRVINQAEVTFKAEHPNIGFSSSLDELAGSCSQSTEQDACHVNRALAAAKKKRGYHFTYAPVHDAKSGLNIGYTVHADPVPEPPPALYERHYFTDQTGIISFGSSADTANTALQ